MAEAIKRRRYEEAFKRQAVKLLIDSGKPVSTVALSMGVERCNLQKWKKKFSPEFAEEPGKSGGQIVRSKEYSALRSEIRSMKETVNHLRNIVKRALTKKYSDVENML